MTFIEEFKRRGYFYQSTNIEELEKKMTQEKIVAYIGFDCTAESLHVGNLMQIMILRLLQNHGHKPIVLIGGGTTKIGDPTGKEEARRRGLKKAKVEVDLFLKILIRGGVISLLRNIIAVRIKSIK